VRALTRPAFTLPELLVCLAIIATLLALIASSKAWPLPIRLRVSGDSWMLFLDMAPACVHNPLV